MSETTNAGEPKRLPISKMTLHEIIELIDTKVADVQPMIVKDSGNQDAVLLNTFQVQRVDFKSAKGMVATISRDGLCVVTPEDGDSFMIEDVTVGEFYLIVELMGYSEKWLRKIAGMDAIGVLRHARYELQARACAPALVEMGATKDELTETIFLDAEEYDLTFRPYPEWTDEKSAASLIRGSDLLRSKWFAVDTLRLYGVLILMGFVSKKG